MPDESKADGRVTSDAKAADTTTTTTRKSSWRIRPMFIIGTVVLVAAVYFGFLEAHKRLTYVFEEDARIHTDLVTVSSRVAGWITKMP